MYVQGVRGHALPSVQIRSWHHLRDHCGSAVENDEAGEAALELVSPAQLGLRAAQGVRMGREMSPSLRGVSSAAGRERLTKCV